MTRRGLWQIALQQKDDGLSAVVELPAPFLTMKLFLMPADLVFEGIATNGEPWKDHMGRVLDREFFEQWKTPEALLGPQAAHINELRMRDNAVQAVLQNGDRVELRVSWRGAPQEKMRAVLHGLVAVDPTKWIRIEKGRIFPYIRS